MSPQAKTIPLQSNGILTKVASAIFVENKISAAEKKILDERSKNIQTLRSIRGYLRGIKHVTRP